jgi:hypothetical protein
VGPRDAAEVRHGRSPEAAGPHRAAGLLGRRDRRQRDATRHAKEAEIKELEKARFGIRKSANTGPQGLVFQEIWENIDGEAVEQLTKNPAYAGKPTQTSLRDSFEGAKNFTNSYGSRIRGFIHPPVTGLYTFWIACDDTGELQVSLDDTPTRKRLVCSCPSSCNPREWGRNPAQKSAPILLQAGKRYYIEALHKEGGATTTWRWAGRSPTAPKRSRSPAPASRRGAPRRRRPARQARSSSAATT